MLWNKQASIITKIKRKKRAVENEGWGGKSEKENEHERKNSEICHPFKVFGLKKQFYFTLICILQGIQHCPRIEASAA